MQVLRGIGNQYRNLLTGGGDDAEEGSGSNFWQKYGWIALIDKMADGKREMWDYYFDLNIIEFLNTVAFYKDKTDHERKEHERALRNGKI